MTVLWMIATDDIATAVRGVADDSVVLAMPDVGDPLSLAMARASIAPLAIERAPGTRVNAVIVSASAYPADVAAAIDFLERAGSTTGQLLDIA